jgi:outer membrane receptor protein involved in Fe transport
MPGNLPAPGAIDVIFPILAASVIGEPTRPAELRSPPVVEARAGDIVVTGERVTRSLKETPSSVYVATQAEIEAQGADRVEEVLALIPNVQLGSGSAGPAIRGQDTTGALNGLPAFLGGNRPRTTMIVDGRPTTYSEFVFGVAPAWDVNRIEVFRSPQTTTQGQNSIAGAIFVNTNDPTFEPEYKARAIVGDFKTRQLSALASGPIAGDSVAFRVAGDFHYSRTTSRIADRVEGADPNHDVYGLIRAKLRVKPAGLAGTRLDLTYSHIQSQAPQIVGVTAPFRKRRDASGFYGTFRINVDSLTAAVQHQSGDVTANLLLTAGDSVARRLAFPGAGQARIGGRDWSVEAVFNWAPEGPVRLVGGLSHRRTRLRQFIDLSVLSGLGRFRDWQYGTGIFGEARLAITPKATFTAGLRSQHDRQKRNGSLGDEPSSIDLDYDRSFHAWLPKVSFAYDFTPSFRAGALVQRAYNPGGTTVRFDTGQPDNFEAETLWDYELFGRAVLAGGRLTAETNLFYYDMRNAQRAEDIVVLGPHGFPVGFANLFNVPKARSYGLEAAANWKATGRLSGRIALGMLNTKIVRASAEDAALQGKQFGRSPHFTASASVDWRPSERLRLSAQARHHSPYFSDDENNLNFAIGSATIVNARAEYRLGQVSLFGYARNLFNTFRMVDRSATVSSAEDPREVGVGIEASF